MSKSEASHPPPEPSGRDAPGDGETQSADSLGPAVERELAARVKQGDRMLEAILSSLMPRLLTSLEGRGCGPFETANLDPPIRDGLREALLEHCPRGQPGDGLAPRALLRVRERVSVFLDREASDRDGAAFNGTAWAREHINRDLFGDCLGGPELAQAWPALRRRADAIRRLVEAHLRLASTLARCYMGRGLDFDDLRQIAAISLDKAAQSFDPQLGVPFHGFASTIIRNDLAGALRTARGGTVHGARQRAHFKSAERRLAQVLGRRPTQAEVFESLGWGDTRRKNLERGLLTAHPQSLERYEEENGALPRDVRASEPAAEAERREDLEIAHAALEGLEERERQVFLLRHVDPETLTQEETAKRLGLPLSRVRKLEGSAREKLRAPFQVTAAPQGIAPRR
jgi:RNA polymerase sigma factor (sigma-70 family)